MGVSDHRSRFIALGRIRRRRGSSMVMPSLKSGSGAARRRFWLAMSGFVMALALMPNPDIANQNRRRAAPLPDFKLGITIEDPRRLLIRPRAMKRQIGRASCRERE